MARTDRRGRGLRLFLIAEIVMEDVTVEQIQDATGVKRGAWYGKTDAPGRADADDFPNPSELRKMADYYSIGDDGYLNLMVEFGWIEPRPGSPGYTAPLPPNQLGDWNWTEPDSSQKKSSA